MGFPDLLFLFQMLLRFQTQFPAILSLLIPNAIASWPEHAVGMLQSLLAYHAPCFWKCPVSEQVPSGKPLAARYGFLKAPVNSRPAVGSQPGAMRRPPPAPRQSLGLSKTPQLRAPGDSGPLPCTSVGHSLPLRRSQWRSHSRRNLNPEGATEGGPGQQTVGRGRAIPYASRSHQWKKTTMPVMIAAHSYRALGGLRASSTL